MLVYVTETAYEQENTGKAAFKGQEYVSYQ